MVDTTTKRLVWYQSYHREQPESGSAHGKEDFSVVKVYVDKMTKSLRPSNQQLKAYTYVENFGFSLRHGRDGLEDSMYKAKASDHKNTRSRLK